jgi:uncharacterized protein YodC (DUF2158 family)
MTGQKFYTGQKVKLKSGGPVMTVMGTNAMSFNANQSSVCQWFAGKTLKQAEFPNASLEMTTETEVPVRGAKAGGMFVRGR